MADWQERITHETAPAIRAEHELRYRIAAPLILAGGPWVDLGCGNGLAAAAALGADRPAHAVLVDVEQEAVASAVRALRVPDTHQFAGDLTDPDLLAQLADALRPGEGEPVATCFEVIEHLSSFVPLLEWSSALVRDRAATFILSVPNDAFWSIENPHHRTTWGEGSLEELRQLIPSEHTLLRQVSLSGSALVAADAAPAQAQLAVPVGGDGTVATHFILAFGPRHADVRPAATAVQTDVIEQRRWERQRESNAAIAQQVVDEHRALAIEHEATITRQAEELRANTREFDAWRTYIHELEQELGRPLSGASKETAVQNVSKGAAAPAALNDRERPVT